MPTDAARSDARSATRRLGRAARPLKPTTAPYYVHNPRPERGEHAPGWYWQPAEAEQVEYLAYNMDGALRVIFAREAAGQTQVAAA